MQEQDETTQTAVALMGGVIEALENPDYFERLAAHVRTGLSSEGVTRWLDSRLSVGDVTELAVAVTVNEPDPSWTDDIGFRTEEAKHATVLLWLRGFEPEEIATIVAQPLARVERTLEKRHSPNPHERTIVHQFLAGVPVTEIAAGTGVQRQTVYAVLERAGIQADTRNRTPKNVKVRIVAMRNEGASYAEIRQATGASTEQIKCILRHAAKRGEVQGYGQQVAA